jgi:transposase-like protein
MAKSSSRNNESVKLTQDQKLKLLEILLPLDLQKVIQVGIEDYIGTGTRMLLQLLMDKEAQELCGDWYARNPDRKAVRWGVAEGTAVVGGAKRPVLRPRVRLFRTLDGKSKEVRLASYDAMNRGDLIDRHVTANILAGVSTRNYARLLERSLEAKGVKKSTISRRAIASTKPMVEEFRKQKLDHLDLVVLLLDGINVGKRQMIACLGIDINGRKHVLGLRLGATENDIVCRDLIRDLVERGVDPQKKYLFVIDGSRALANSIRAAFGQDTAIQRCQEHKIRDVQGYVPVKRRAEVRKKLQAAYNEPTEKAAFKRLEKLRLELSLVSESASNALTEGLYETLTVHRLGLTGYLRASLRTTNIMESVFSAVRRYMGHTCRFRKEENIELWVTRSILEAERHLRPVKGHRQLRRLRQTLGRTDPRLQR